MLGYLQKLFSRVNERYYQYKINSISLAANIQIFFHTVICAATLISPIKTVVSIGKHINFTSHTLCVVDGITNI